MVSVDENKPKLVCHWEGDIWNYCVTLCEVLDRASSTRACSIGTKVVVCCSFPPEWSRSSLSPVILWACDPVRTQGKQGTKAATASGSSVTIDSCKGCVVLCSAVMCGEVLCSVVMFSVVLCSVVLCSVVMCSVVMCSVWCSEVCRSSLQWGVVEGSLLV